MSKRDAETTIQELKDLVARFEKERGWEKHHTPKNIAIALCLEAAELLEHFQWDAYHQEDKQAIADELADVVFNCLGFAITMDIDITSSFIDKFKRTEKKYPVNLFNPDTDNTDEYFRIKKAYRGQGGDTK
ncbi:MAG TPA: nucleotide pyrophosphohydrolase [Verrucomicrobiae bacterium]|jgi:dCTP diphosphatase|nr:nucleotide pyrophosphohydrolase [Verrucomicrobiae bacterium]